MASGENSTKPSSKEDELNGKYLSFSLGDEIYGLQIGPIDDIIELREITSVPRTPDSLEGVINLRGTVVPVLDIRKRFDMPVRDYDERTCIVVVEREGVRFGLIVDRVREVIDLFPQQVDSAPSMGHSVDDKFLEGLGRIDGNVLMLVDLDNLLDEDQQSRVEELSG